MQIKAQSGTPKEKEYAKKLLPIISNHHLLLVSLMLWNASATEALPIFLSGLVSEYVAIILSVTLVLMFGEIIPASILTGPKQLQIAAALVPMVYVVFIVFFPIAYPVSKLLDWLIGHEGGVTMYSRKEIATMMKLQHEEGMRRISLFKAGHKSDSLSAHDAMQHEEVTIIGGALKYRDMKVSEVMTPETSCFMISVKETLSYKTMYEIFKSGYSRIPVFERDRHDVVGLILAKDLIFVDPEDEIPIENFIGLFGRKPMTAWHDQALGETLASFRQERAHMAIVRDVVSEGGGDPYYVVVGIITLEDIIEEILGAEIEDETDAAADAYAVAGGQFSPNNAGVVLRDMDLARFKALRSKITDESLSVDEVEAIVAYLSQQVPEIQELLRMHGLEHEQEQDALALLEDIVRKAPVFNMKRKTPLNADKPNQDDILYRRGKLSNSCILILQGRVKLLHGQLENTSVLGSWSTLGAQALVVTEGTYIPDFTAFVDSDMLRFIRLSAFQSTNHSEHREGWSTLDMRRKKELMRVRSLTTGHDSTLLPASALRAFSSPSPSPLERARTTYDTSATAASKSHELISVLAYDGGQSKRRHSHQDDSVHAPLLLHDINKDEHHLPLDTSALRSYKNVSALSEKGVEGYTSPSVLPKSDKARSPSSNSSRQVTFGGKSFALKEYHTFAQSW